MIFRETAERCLLDVRDRSMKYEKSPSCSQLKMQSQRYIDAGGQIKDEPARTALVAEEGRRMAWTARAISVSGNPTLSLW
jgi:hypothetical protein